MNTQKLLAFVRLYIIIFQVLVKHYLNTKRMQIKQMLRPLSSDFCLTIFAPTSAFHAFGHQSSSDFPSDFFEGDPKPTRRNTEQPWEKGRSWSGISRVMLSCLAIVSMFSLSAQTPRKDSGADGLPNVTPIGVDYYVPDDFWDQQLTIYSNGKTSVVSMVEFRGKPLILDFWSISCASCISKFPKLDMLQQEFQGNFNLLLVNHEGKDVIHGMRNDFLRDHKLPTVYGDKYLNALFPHRGVPYYVWITPIGRVAAITSAEFVDHGRVKAFIDYSLKYEMPN
ncbi:MAG: hypothetical protein K0R59_585 [Sphingobacterium sp.]|jgi:thiol-disulfide isomerase/thioredoxin|nr:hypothetical protein [Sphingobacterium sp.]